MADDSQSNIDNLEEEQFYPEHLRLFRDKVTGEYLLKCVRGGWPILYFKLDLKYFVEVKSGAAEIKVSQSQFSQTSLSSE